jgi:hypothetical protein
MANRTKHVVVIQAADGDPEKHAIRPWLREHPEDVPPGLNPNINNSHELRRGLQRMGWPLVIDDVEARSIKPDTNGSTAYAKGLIDIESEFGEDKQDEEIEEAEDNYFRLERDLQKALRANIEQLEPGLKIIDGGKERVTEEPGRIDITAIDLQDNIVVIELKAGTAKPEVVVQVLAYMASVAASDKKPVRGILVASGFHRRVALAAEAVPNLQLRTYSFQFRFDVV